MLLVTGVSCKSALLRLFGDTPIIYNITLCTQLVQRASMFFFLSMEDNAAVRYELDKLLSGINNTF